MDAPPPEDIRPSPRLRILPPSACRCRRFGPPTKPRAAAGGRRRPVPLPLPAEAVYAVRRRRRRIGHDAARCASTRTSGLGRRRWRAPRSRPCSTGGGRLPSEHPPRQPRGRICLGVAHNVGTGHHWATCFVHRTFSPAACFGCRNARGAACGLDQRPAISHPAYDLASLLQDARRDVPAAVAAMAIERFLTAHPELDPVQFHAAYAAPHNDICGSPHNGATRSP